jgi:hypothetical protein
MTVEDDRDNAPLEEQVFGVILLVPLFTVFFLILLLIASEVYDISLKYWRDINDIAAFLEFLYLVIRFTGRKSTTGRYNRDQILSLLNIIRVTEIGRL